MNDATGNLLLDCLPIHSRSTIVEHAEQVALPKDTVLFEPDSTPRHAHFLTSGIAKWFGPLEDGAGVTCGLCGAEGVPEALHLLNSGRIGLRGVIEAPARAWRIDFGRLHRLAETDAILRTRVMEFVMAQTLAMTQLVSCGALHDVDARLARLLLTLDDRGAGAIPVTQDCLGRMLGARRTTITVAACGLQDRGLIGYSRGQVVIMDRPGLSKAACECYPPLRQLQRKLYGDTTQPFRPENHAA